MKSERKLFIKAIAITSAFFLTYSFELIMRLYQFSTKTETGVLVDLIGTVGIAMNTLLNSLVLLKYDGLVQSSAIEMLGLEERYRKRRYASKKATIIQMTNRPINVNTMQEVLPDDTKSLRLST